MRLFFCTILYLTRVIRASQTTNTSDGSEVPSLSFTNRTLWNIASSCLLTLFACIYSTVHPNIPSPEDSTIRILRRRLGMMIMVLFYPELIIAWAMGHFLYLAHFLLGPHAEVVALAVQGYGLTRALAKPFKRLLKDYVSKQSEDYKWTQTHSFFALMDGFMLYDIPDKSKGNVISKGTSMLQVGWFVLQLITRAVYHLDTTELEIATLAFAVLNFLTYPMWWNKPFDVQCPHPVYWRSTTSIPSDHFDQHEDFRESLPVLLQICTTPLLSPVGMLGASDPDGSTSS
ncbi:hypothetical protein DFJ58DRAFT_842887 [Suillus subalutaceus]|uniref:uncharacterized protein n=1 Tax=Suillus subalutaceus TaxID=48586 RepID=UPI001B87009A|nr:uncharacterized protein DFJ58DRAFT_842887 [Suillus subalutaceus]KAG1848509.1 hypothetical protein DFJ58DRAFT_842887 [Suillus subalutaceus]